MSWLANYDYMTLYQYRCRFTRINYMPLTYVPNIWELSLYNNNKDLIEHRYII